MTQTELANRAGITQTTLSGIESGVQKKTRYLVELATALGVEPTWLMGANISASGTSHRSLSETESDLIRQFRSLKTSDKSVVQRVIEGLARKQ